MDVVSASESADQKIAEHPEETIHTSNGQGTLRRHELPAKPTIDATAASHTELEARALDAHQDDSQDPHLDTGRNPGSGATSLPPEVLQHIFSFVDPVSLGRLLFVNRMCNALVDPAKPLPSASTNPTTLRLRPQDDLWSSSRKNFMSTYSRPIAFMTEIEMWRLIRGTICQFCGKKPKNRIPLLAMATSPWNAGPGPEGVRAIWPFKCLSCGPCLESRIIKVAYVGAIASLELIVIGNGSSTFQQVCLATRFTFCAFHTVAELCNVCDSTSDSAAAPITTH